MKLSAPVMSNSIRQTERRYTRSRRRVRCERSGSATVELAFVLPLFMILTFGSLEVCHRLFTRQAVVIVAYETARAATRQNSDTSAVTTKCQELLSQSNIQGATIQVRDMTHGQNDLDAITTGDEIRIRITVPWGQNTISRFVVPDQGTFLVDAVMLRE
ncbi:MAG: pilus assembly protein [Pirellulaceae bacterium]